MLNNQVVAVTGGAGLIGSTLTRTIVEAGGKVIIGDVSVDKGMDLQNELGLDHTLFVDFDTTDVDSIDNFIECGKNHFGKIDSAVHSAYPRSQQWGTKFEDLKPEGLQQDLFNQLGGAILFSQRIIEEFKSKQNGNLIDLWSLWNRRQSTKFNGVGYIVQRGAEAVYSKEGKSQINFKANKRKEQIFFGT